MRLKLTTALGLSTAALILAGCGSVGGGQGIVANGPVPLNNNPLVGPPVATPTPFSPTPTPAPRPHPGLVTNPSWIPFGPNGGFDPFEQLVTVSGRATALVIDSGDPDIMVLGTASGGIWKTDDGGNQWSPRSDSLPPAIGCLTADPNNPDIIWAGTGEANLSGDAQPGFGLLKSTDEGQTWTQIPDTQNQFTLKSISRIVINPTNSSEMWVATTSASLGGISNIPMTGQIYHSTDGGNTFADVTSGSSIGPNAPIVDLVLQSPGAQPNTAVLLAAVDTSMFQDFFAVPAANDGRSGIYLSADSGKTWTQQTNGLPSGTNIGRISLAVAPSDPTVVYALVGATGTDPTTQLPNDTFNGLYVSTDSGSGWQQMNLSPNPFTIPQGGEALIGDDGTDAFQTQYNQFLVVDPTTPTRLYMAGLAINRVDGISLTGFTGNVTALSQSNPELPNGPHTDQHFAAIDRVGNLYALDDGGIYQQTNPTGANLSTAWNDLNTNIETLQFYTGSTALDPSNNLLGLGGTQDNGILSNLVSNGNQTFSGITNVWNEVFTGDGGGVAADPIQPNVQYLTDGTFSFPYGPGFIQQAVTLPNTSSGNSTANQASYTDVSNGFNFNDATATFIPVQVSSQNDNNVLVATNRIYESTNAASDLNGGGGTVTFSDISGVLVTDIIALPNSTLTFPDAFSAAEYAPSDDDVIFAVSGGGKVFRRQFRGSGFIECDFGIPAGTPLSSLNIDPSDPTHVVVAAAQTTGGAFGVPNVPGRVFETNNSGATWRDITGNLPNLPVTSIVQDPRFVDVFYAGTVNGVYISQNDGGGWTLYGTGLPGVQVPALNILSAGQLEAYTHGRSMWAVSTSSSTTITGPSGAVTPHAKGVQGIVRPHRHR